MKDETKPLAKLSRATILQAVDLPTEVVFVPEWGGEVTVRALSGLERDTYEMEIYRLKGTKIDWKRENMRARLVAATVVDDAGELMFSTADIAALGNKSAAALERIFVVAQRLSGLSKEDVEELEADFA